jgi:hypothetical protein
MDHVATMDFAFPRGEDATGRTGNLPSRSQRVVLRHAHPVAR